MKKSLAIISYILLSILLLNNLLTFIFIQEISLKTNNESLELISSGLIIVYIFETITFIWLVILLLFLIINRIKTSFISSIMMIIIGVIFLFSFILVTWIFGTINIICGIGIITTASIHLKNHRNSL
ncbi:hypothetical protein [Spiroplasma taiwanense]|uniref:Transmembrane protein n=1 Tax=Spiroplasma taiwanense CT-1 TaxID=1276220 RepID=S5MG58_9MOLU|nr:hypothetical protein [Spiroplasma taiwanense]AGR40840.1 hypothetical protein STAIW_v1c01610 [Spiroplasma taiwanense CT-1]